MNEQIKISKDTEDLNKYVHIKQCTKQRKNIYSFLRAMEDLQELLMYLASKKT